MRSLLQVRELPCPVAAAPGGLLRLLLIWLREVPTAAERNDGLVKVSFDELSGRQLDALVARRVLGLEVLETSDLIGEKEWDFNARRLVRAVPLWLPVP